MIDGACQLFNAGMTCKSPTNVLDVMPQRAQLAGHGGRRARVFLVQNHMWDSYVSARIKFVHANT